MDDQVFLDENDVTVTRDQLVVAGASFRIREIRRVGVTKRRRSRLLPILLAMVGLAMWIPDTEAWWIGYAGLVVVAVAWVWVRKIKTNHRIILDTLNGEMTALETQDERWTEKIVKAVRDAMAARQQPRSASRPDTPKD